MMKNLTQGSWALESPYFELGFSRIMAQMVGWIWKTDPIKLKPYEDG